MKATAAIRVSTYRMGCAACGGRIRIGVTYWEGGPHRRLHMACAAGEIGPLWIELLELETRLEQLARNLERGRWDRRERARRSHLERLANKRRKYRGDEPGCD